MFITHCRFKRTERGPWESGLSIGKNADDTQIIIDKEFKQVITTPWDYTMQFHVGAINIELE